MSKGPWKQSTRTKRVVLKPFGDAASAVPPVIDAAPQLPPPLPPLSGPPPASGGDPFAQPTGTTQGFDETKIKAGLGKAFCSATQGVAVLLSGLVKSRGYAIEFTPVEAVEGELWAEFALPVLKMHMPNFEKNPHTVLAVMTVAILSGKFRIKKTGGERYANTAPSADAREENAGQAPT